MKIRKRLLLPLFSLSLLPLLTGMFNPVESNNIETHEQFAANAIHDSSITLLNWNIHKEVTNSSWLTDFNNLMNQHSPDIITLQEAQSHDSLKTALGFGRGYIFAANVKDSEGSSSGVLTASDATPTHYNHLLTTFREPLMKTPKISLATHYRLTPSDKLLKVINVHGINFVSIEKFAHQMKTIEESINSHTGPVVLLGDFNTWKKSRMKILHDIALRQNLSHVEFSQGDSENIKQFMDNPLDHIFFSNDLELSTSGYDVLENVTSSDHKPMLVTLKMKNT